MPTYDDKLLRRHAAGEARWMQAATANGSGALTGKALGVTRFVTANMARAAPALAVMKLSHVTSARLDGPRAVTGVTALTVVESLRLRRRRPLRQHQ